MATEHSIEVVQVDDILEVFEVGSAYKCEICGQPVVPCSCVYDYLRGGPDQELPDNCPKCRGRQMVHKPIAKA